MISSSSKPTNLDATRVLQVLDELKESLTVFSVLTPEVIAKLNSEAGRETAQKLGEYVIDLVNEHQRLLEAQSSVSDQTQAPLISDSQQLTPLARATLEVSRRVGSDFIPELRAFQVARPQGLLNFLRTVLDLQTVVWKKISSTVEEDRNRAELIGNFLAQEKASLVRKSELTDQLAKLRDERNSQNARHSQIIHTLRADLVASLGASDEKLQKLENAHKEEISGLQAQFAAAKTALDAEHATLVGNLAKQSETFSAETENLRKSKNRKSTDVEHLIGNFDGSLAKLAPEISDLRKALARDEEKLAGLQSHFRAVDAESARASEERMLEEARQRKLRGERNRLDGLASNFQAYWRGVLGREEFVKLKKAAKKKGGKKKKQ